MKVLVVLMLACFLCTSCTALPAEERAFVVALCVEKTDEWQIYGRIPTYQSGGGYRTVKGSGATVEEALLDMENETPMRINLSQTRILAAEAELAGSGELSVLLSALEKRRDMRMQCAVLLTESASAAADALQPMAGARLSKTIELMLKARIEQGVILPSTLADVIRMGERQTPVLPAMLITGDTIAIAGGYTEDGLLLPPEEVQLLSMLLESTHQLQLVLPGGYASVRDVSAKVRLSDDLTTARVQLTLTETEASLSGENLRKELAEALLKLLTKLSAAGCDALGLGRQAVMRCIDMAQWRAMNWPEKYRSIRWEIAVGVNEST